LDRVTINSRTKHETFEQIIQPTINRSLTLLKLIKVNRFTVLLNKQRLFLPESRFDIFSILDTRVNIQNK